MAKQTRDELLAIRLRNARLDADLTQEDAATRLGLSKSAVGQWEMSRAAPVISLLPSVCRLYGVSADALLGLTADQVAPRKAESTRLDPELQKILDIATQLPQSQRAAVVALMKAMLP
jgi:transcriptional regulator with XRE-family HTH domain